MNIKTLFSLTAFTAVLASCGGGDINLDPSNTVTDSNNTTIINEGNGGGEDNPCASYERDGQTFAGVYDSTNCTYSSSFVSDTRPLTVDLFIPELAGGVHIFEDSLWVGEDVDQNAAASGVIVPQDGQGPRLTIEAGANIAFSASSDYLRIARGSRIFAEGTSAKPIILSAVADLIDDSATLGDRGLWGGVQINGNGITNKCTDAQRAPANGSAHGCHVTAEGRPSTYGGNNNAENSGVLRYVVIKHAGFEVVDGDELNGLTLNGVGSGTTIEFVQTYTTQDDGFEMFGGAVNMKNIVAVNVGDDSIDYSEGYVGNIQFALVVHPSGANRCIEGDNTGGGRDDGLEPLTKLRISNMTCITSNVDENGGDFASSKGDSEGPLFREGVFFEMYNSIVTSNEAVMASNECLELADSEGPQTTDAATAGVSTAKSNFIACTEATKLSTHADTDATFNLDTWLANADNTNNVIISDAAQLPVVVIEGLADSPTAYVTAAAFSDATTAAITVPVFDVTSLMDDFDAGDFPQIGDSGDSSFFEEVDFIGAVSADNDWVAGWTVGLSN